MLEEKHLLEITFCDFEAVRRDEVTDLIAASYQVRQDLQDAAIKTASSSR